MKKEIELVGHFLFYHWEKSGSKSALFRNRRKRTKGTKNSSGISLWFKIHLTMSYCMLQGIWFTWTTLGVGYHLWVPIFVPIINVYLRSGLFFLKSYTEVRTFFQHCPRCPSKLMRPDLYIPNCISLLLKTNFSTYYNLFEAISPYSFGYGQLSLRGIRHDFGKLMTKLTSLYTDTI